MFATTIFRKLRSFSFKNDVSSAAFIAGNYARILNISVIEMIVISP